MTKLIKFTRALFCNIKPYYYFRHFVFGIAMSFLAILIAGLHFQTVIMIVICTFLYPYSRFVYEAIIDFIMGDNVIISNIIPALIFKFFTMTFCFYLAPFIAPVGLVLLYFLQRKNTKTEIE